MTSVFILSNQNARILLWRKRQGVRRGFRPNDRASDVDCFGTNPPGEQGVSYRSDGEWRLGSGWRHGQGQRETLDLSAGRIDPDYRIIRYRQVKVALQTRSRVSIYP